MPFWTKWKGHRIQRFQRECKQFIANEKEPIYGNQSFTEPPRKKSEQRQI